jgi:alpha-1,3-rhamnosyl/mannosyltransferase
MSFSCRILFDARTVRPGRTGVGYYAQAMMQSLAELESAGMTALICEPDKQLAIAPNLKLYPVRTQHDAHPFAELFLQFSLGRIIRKTGSNVYWNPAFVLPGRKYPGCLYVVTIHDLSVFSHPQLYPRRFAAYLRRATRNSIKMADIVFCDSSYVCEEIAALFPSAVAKTRVLYAAADPAFQPLVDSASSMAASPRPYVLTVGHGDPRKRTDIVLQASRLARETIEHDLKIVGATGKKDPSMPWCTYTGHVSRETLRELYCNASAFLFASETEGFGMPVLEAMACGCPVIASATGSIPEIAGAAAHLFSLDEHAAESAASLLCQVLGSPETAAETRRKGFARASEFSFRKSAGLAIREISAVLET